MATRTNYGMILPHRWQKIGLRVLMTGFLVIFLASALETAGILTSGAGWMERFFYPIWPLVIHISLFLICLSSEKEEDEFVMHIRMGILKKILCYWFVVTLLSDSLQWVLSRLGSPDSVSTLRQISGGLSNVYLLATVYIIWLKNKLDKFRKEAARD